MEQNNTQTSAGNQSILREIIYVLKKNIILLLAVIFAVIAIGTTYAYVRKPNYIATEKLFFRMGDSAYIADDINTMSAYKSTVQSFANQGKVVDRANYYATKYYEFFSKGDDKIDLETFIQMVDSLEGQINSFSNEKKLWEEIQAIATTLQENHVSSSIDGVRDKLLAQRLILYGCTFLMQRIRLEEVEIQKLADGEKKALLQNSVDNCKKSLSTLLKKDPNLITSEVYLNVIYDARHYDMQNLVIVDDETYSSAFATTFLDKNDESHGAILKQAYKDRITEIEDSIENLQTSDQGKILYYDINKPEIKAMAGKQEYIQASEIGINSTEQDEKTFVFSVSYNDEEETLAKEKVKLLVLAFDIESSYFFTAKNTTIDDLGLISCSVDISTKIIILISSAIGIVVALITVYLVYVLDKTIKTKEEAEKIAECIVLACIEAQEEV